MKGGEKRMKKYDGGIMDMADAVEDALLVVRDAWLSAFVGDTLIGQCDPVAIAILAAALILKEVRGDGKESE